MRSDDGGAPISLRLTADTLLLHGNWQLPIEVVGARPPECKFAATSAVDGLWGNWEGFLLERGGSALRSMTGQREREEDRMVWLTALVDVMTCITEGGKSAFDWRKFGRGRVNGLVDAVMGLLSCADSEEYAMACGVLLVLNANLVPAGKGLMCFEQGGMKRDSRGKA